MRRFEEFIGEEKKETIPITGSCSTCDVFIKEGVVVDGNLLMVCPEGHETKIKWNFDV